MLLISKEWYMEESLQNVDTAKMVDELLKIRGVAEDERREFVSSVPNIWHNPLLFKDMRNAVEIISNSIANKERILVYGDYDADGVTATTILVRYLRSHDCDVDFIIPHRTEHGYGLTQVILDEVLSRKPKLLITVDCGITNNDEVKYLKNKGIKVVVTDHHNVKGDLPIADAIISAKCEDNTYPFSELCGAGVALKLVEAMGKNTQYKVTKDCWCQCLELAGIATIADMVPLINENRTLVKNAFRSMRNPANLGIRTMFMQLIGQSKQSIDEEFVSFNFIPRINAAGRLHDASLALELFMGEDPVQVSKVAQELTDNNDERKSIEAKVFEEALSQLENPERPEKWSVINTTGPLVVYSDKWHQGVLGIVAGKLSQHFRRSAIVFTEDSLNKDLFKGSGRSFGEFDLYKALEETGELCLNFGGHKKAAGVVVRKSDLAAFIDKLEFNANKQLMVNEKQKDSNWNNEDDTLWVDIILKSQQINFATYDEICKLKPFGIGNKKLTLVTKNLTIANVVGMSDGKHVRLDVFDANDSIGTDNTQMFSVVGFGMGYLLQVLKQGDIVDIAYTLSKYNFRGNTVLSLHLLDLKLHYNDFLWDKVSNVEKLFKSGLELMQLSKLVGNDIMRLIPNEQHYKDCYVVLSKLSQGGLMIADVDLLSRMINNLQKINLTPFQLLRCMEVFADVGLIKMKIINSTRVCFSFVKVNEKKHLSSSEVYKRMAEYVK